MRITTDAIAGTLESSDALVRVSPHPKLEIELSSTVMAQYGDQILAVVHETLTKLGIDQGLVSIEDKGALDCTLRARVQAAAMRGAAQQPDWSAL